MVCSSEVARHFPDISVCTILVLLLLADAALASQPTHRYSFTSDANDSIGTAHGTLLGNATITDRNLVLNGTNGCVQLPANLFTNSRSLTLEIWFVNNQPGSAVSVVLFRRTGNLVPGSRSRFRCGLSRLRPPRATTTLALVRTTLACR